LTALAQGTTFGWRKQCAFQKTPTLALQHVVGSSNGQSLKGEPIMSFQRLAFALCITLLAALAPPAAAWNRSPATQFATLPAGTAHPEGITADARGNLYVANFDVSGNTSVGTVVVFDRNGRWLRTLTIDNASNLLLGIAFNPVTHDLLVLDFGNKNVLRIDPQQSGSGDVFATIPGGAAAGPNALAFDAAGNVYVSDSFQATIWRLPKGGHVAPSVFVADDLLGTTGVPPFGANGLAFNSDYSALFVANTGNDTIVRINLPNGPSGTPDAPEVFVNSINGADGLIIDASNNLWVAANQADEIVVVDPTGRVIAKLGDFNGIDRQGAPVGLLFPASLVMVNNFIYVTNLSLDLRGFGLPQAVDSQWTAQVKRHTIARIHAHLPPVRGSE
jgi:sugar lactone lactonase YvrE